MLSQLSYLGCWLSKINSMSLLAKEHGLEDAHSLQLGGRDLEQLAQSLLQAGPLFVGGADF